MKEKNVSLPRSDKLFYSTFSILGIYANSEVLAVCLAFLTIEMWINFKGVVKSSC